MAGAMFLRAWIALCRLAGMVTIAGFVVAVFTPAPNLVARRFAVPANIGPADAIVVLGSFAHRDGSLSDSSLRRALAGIRLHRQGLAPRLVFLGLYSEADARAKLAVDLGVDRTAIEVSNEPPTTREEAARVRDILRRTGGAHTILLVTDALHMRRARALFERVGFAVRAAPTDTGMLGSASHEERLRLTRVVGQELVALGYHKVFGYL
jgi:uncharacterized SAM-binding protein YcdF (DUF218 family)